MRNLKLLFIIIVLFLSKGIINAQEEKKEEKKESYNFTVSAELRPRTEYVHGVKSPMLEWKIPDEYKETGELFTTQRSRFGVRFSNDKFKFGIQFQDVRTWGSQPKLVSNDLNDTYIHQAWGELSFTKEISLKVGRMELAYDDQRILGSVNWTQQAYSHDLALFKYEGNVKVHLGIAYHGTPYEGLDSYKAMQFLWVNGKVDDLGYSFLFLNDGQRENGIWVDDFTSFVASDGERGYIGVSEKNAYTQIVGGRFTYKYGDLNFALNTYYQMGKKTEGVWVDEKSLPTGITAADLGMKNDFGQGQKISAYNIAFDAMYKATDDIKVGLGYEVLSGNDLTDATRTDENAFSPLHGTNHKFNGWMDYFYVGNHASSVGLQDINMKLIYKKGAFFAKLIPHYFMPAGSGTYIDAHGNTQDIDALGTEIDLWLGYNIVPKVASIQFGYSQMFATESMYGLKGVTTTDTNGIGTNNWAWIMIDIKPKWNFKK